MTYRLIVAIDGHDGAGKTTLAAALSAHVGGAVVSPFSGNTGIALLKAGENGNIEELVKIGSSAIEQAVSSVSGHIPIILDRGWMTVASFVSESSDFYTKWKIWLPTVLCWADLRTTLSRLAMRGDEIPESPKWHEHYIATYQKLADLSRSYILRTDLIDYKTCTEQLIKWFVEGPTIPQLRIK